MKWVARNQIVALSLTIIAAALLVSPAHADPKVIVVNTTNNPVPVQLASGSNAPVIVRAVDSPAPQPFQTRTNITLAAGVFGALPSLFTVPAGKRLVLEFASTSVFMPSGQPIRILHVGINNPSVANADIYPTFRLTASGDDIYSGSQLIRLYVEPGQEVLVDFERPTTTGTASANVTLSGYFVDVQ